jgi:hypothetical protein
MPTDDEEHITHTLLHINLAKSAIEHAKFHLEHLESAIQNATPDDQKPETAKKEDKPS